jgi:glycosyltransferase involved in cell wall biosynthesis
LFSGKRIFELPYSNRAAFVHSVGDTEDIKRYGIQNKIIEIPNGITLKNIPKEFNNNLIHDNYPQTINKKKIVFLGRLDPLHKGLDLMLKAFALAQLKESVLFLIGPDFRNNKSKLEFMAKELGIQNNVIFVGPLYGNDKYNFLFHSDIFIHTSRWEGMPFSVIEAMSMKIPCLLTSPANPMNKIVDNVSGWVVDINIKDIAKKLKIIEKLEISYLKKIGSKGYQIVQKYFTWDNIANQMLINYQNVINEKHGKRGN